MTVKEAQTSFSVPNLGRNEENKKRETDEGLHMALGQMIPKLSGLKSEQEKKKESVQTSIKRANGVNRQEGDEAVDKKHDP